jgi:hypothetical protein
MKQNVFYEKWMGIITVERSFIHEETNTVFYRRGASAEGIKDVGGRYKSQIN